MFTFAAGLGLDAEATAIVDRVRHERPGNERPGDLRVLTTALGVLRKEGFALHERMTLRTDGESHRCSHVAVANQHPYTFLGPIPVRAAPGPTSSTASTSSSPASCAPATCGGCRCTA